MLFSYFGTRLSLAESKRKAGQSLLQLITERSRNVIPVCLYVCVNGSKYILCLIAYPLSVDICRKYNGGRYNPESLGAFISMLSYFYAMFSGFIIL